MFPPGNYILRCARTPNKKCLVENVETGQLVESSNEKAVQFKLDYVYTNADKSNTFTLFSIDSSKIVSWKEGVGIGAFDYKIGSTNAIFEIDDVSSLDGAVTIRLSNYHTGKPLVTFSKKYPGIWANAGQEGVKFLFEQTQ